MKVHEKPRRRIELADWEWAYLHDPVVQKTIGIDPSIDRYAFYVSSEREQHFWGDILQTIVAQRFKAGWDAHEQWCVDNEASFDKEVGWFVADRG